MKSRKQRDGKSLGSIAELLGSGTFGTEHVRAVKNYSKKRIQFAQEREKFAAKMKFWVTEFTSNMTEGEKRRFGQYVGMHRSMGFDVGLRLGLTTRLFSSEIVDEQEDDDSATLSLPNSEGEPPCQNPEQLKSDSKLSETESEPSSPQMESKS